MMLTSRAMNPTRTSSRLSTRPFTVTIASSTSLWPSSIKARGKTVTSIVLSRSSRTNTAIWSPFLVNLRAMLVMTPPSTSTEPSSRSGASAMPQSTLRRNAASTPSSGWSDTYRPSISFSKRSRSLLSNSLSGMATRSSNPSALSPPRSPNRLITPWSRSRRRTSVPSMICSKTINSPRRGWPSESNAPALINDSTVRLLSTGSGTRSAKSWNDSNVPLALRSPSSSSTKPSPTLRIADSPNVMAPGEPAGSVTSSAISSGVTRGEVHHRPIDVGRQHLDAGTRERR